MSRARKSRAIRRKRSRARATAIARVELLKHSEKRVDVLRSCVPPSTTRTARAINPDVFVVARQNIYNNYDLYTATRANLIMRPREITARMAGLSISACRR